MIFSGNAVTINKKRRISARLLTALAAIALLLGLVSATFASSSLPDTTADKVWGQGGNFTTSISPNPPTADSLSYPSGVAVDSQGGIYVADQNNKRVLYYPAGATTATRVYGQGAAGNNFSASNAPNPPSATSMNNPYGVAVAPDGSLYVVDKSNSRVLHFPAYNGTMTDPANFTADRVYGQGGSFTSNGGNNGGDKRQQPGPSLWGSGSAGR